MSSAFGEPPDSGVKVSASAGRRDQEGEQRRGEGGEQQAS